MAANKGDSPEILPDGWTLQFSPLKSGREVKCYVNSGTGKKFFSKDDLIRHMKAEKARLNLPKPTKSPDKSPSENNPMCLIECTNERPEWLPHNWMVELKTTPRGKKYKCFVEPMTGNKFYSKPQVFQHLKIAERKKCSVEQKETLPTLLPLPANEISLHDHDAKCFAEPTVNEIYSRPQAFQDLKIMEQEKCSLKQKEILPTLLLLPANEASLQDHDAKCFAEPTINELYSKPQVFQDLTIMEQEKCSLKQNESLPNLLPLPANKISLHDHNAKVSVERSPAEDLPTGWIREIRIQQKAKGVRKDPFYIDPVSGYAFHSKRDAQRYIESGDIKSCKILPKKRDIDDGSLPSSAAKNQKIEHHAGKQELIGQGNSDGNSIASSEVDSLREREGPPASNSTIDRNNMASLEAESSRGSEDKTAIVLTTVAGTTMTEISQKIPSDNDENNCISNQSASTSCEVSKNNQVKNELVTFQDNKKQEQNHESGVKWNESNTTWNSLGKSYHSKVRNMPRRSSKRLAGIEPEIVAGSASGVEAIPETGNKHTQSSPEGGIKGFVLKAISPANVGDTEILNNLGHIINENRNNLPCWTAEQIRMIEAKPVSNTGSIVLALPKTIRSSKSGVILAVGASTGGLAEIPPEQIIDEGKKELVLHACTTSKSPLVREPSNKRQKSDTGCSVQSKAKSIAVSTDDELVSTPKVVNIKDKKSLESGSVRKDQRQTQNDFSSGNIKAAFKLAGLSPKRSAGLEPELVSSSKSIEQGLKNAKRSCRIKSTEAKESISAGLAKIVSQPKDGSRIELPLGSAYECSSLQGEQLNKNQAFLHGKTAEDKSRMLEEISESRVQAPQNARGHKSEPTEAVCLTSGGLANIGSQHINNEQKMKLQHALTTSNISSHGVDWKKKHAFLHDQPVSTEPMLMLESNVVKAESRLIPPFQEFFSDPCLEFAYKTLTGEIPVEITANNGMVSAPVPPVMDEKMKRADRFCNGKTPIKSRTYKTSAQLHLPHEPQQSEKNSTATASSNKRSYKSRPRKSNIIEASGDQDQLKAIPEAECAYYDFASAKVMAQHESSNNVIQHMNEVRENNINKPEPTPLFSYGEYLSDPCLEFAYKTLTGAIPVEDNLPVQNYFQQQVDASQTQKEGSFQQVVNTLHTPRDGSLSLPDFGLPSFFQTDISVHFDALDNQLATQLQVPQNNLPFVPSGSANLPSYSGIGSQQRGHLFSPSCSSIGSQQQGHLNENKVLHGKFNL